MNNKAEEALIYIGSCCVRGVIGVVPSTKTELILVLLEGILCVLRASISLCRAISDNLFCLIIVFKAKNMLVLKRKRLPPSLIYYILSYRDY